jgi:hypothetical protein
VPPRRTVDCRNHWHLDAKQIHQQGAAFPVHTIERVGGYALADCALAWRRPRARPFVTRTSQDYHPVFPVARDICERLGQFTMRTEPPAERTVVGVKAHLQDASLAPHVYA